VSVAGTAHADELKYEFSGKIQSDLRFRLQTLSVGNFFDKAELPAGVERNQNLFSLKFKASYGKFAGVASADVYLNAVGAKLKGFDDLQKYNAVQPFTLEPQNLYVEGKDLFAKGLDVRLGNQLVLWGAADQFNPTNNLNSDDVRDPLLFGKQQPNFMLKVDYWVTKTFSISGVLVPVFKPALLPASAALGAVDIQRMPFANDAFRHRVEGEFGFASSPSGLYPPVVNKLTPVLPDTTADNMQFAYRLAGTFADQDIALSYYLGRTDFPQPFSNHTRQVTKAQCDPQNPTSCIKGTLRTDTLLGYPRMHVFGLNMAGEVNPFKWISDRIHGIGYRLEAALIVPKKSTIRLTQEDLPALFYSAGEYDYDGDGKPGGPNQPTVVESTPFLKWTLGLDYTFGQHVYVNAMWVHGLADEYGAGDWIHQGYTVRESGTGTSLKPASDQTLGNCVTNHDGTKCAKETLLPRLGDYLVLGADFKFLDDAGLLRVFTVWALSGVYTTEYDPVNQKRTLTHLSPFSKDGFSASVYPELSYNFGNGLEMAGGALILLGKSYTKFGDPAAGGSLAFVRGRYSF
jgi:hypothetical protein